MTNPFVLDMISLEKNKNYPASQCYHYGSCSKNLECFKRNRGPAESKMVDYIDQCCCASFPCVNSYGFSSDELTDKHDGSHLLFAGCSYTHGSGVTRKETWAHIIYEKISKEKKCSGFFNIGFPGTSILEQSFMILKYIEKFGKPETIFWLIPPTDRGFSNFQSNNIIDMEDSPANEDHVNNKLNKMYVEKNKGDTPFYSIDLNEFKNYIGYYSIHSYCKTNGINLYSSHWYPEQNNEDLKSKSIFYDLSRIKDLDTFYMWEAEDMIEFCDKFSKNYTGENKKFLQMARDNSHLGIAPQEFWADFIYSKYKKESS
jgi:hypothetical protein